MRHETRVIAAFAILTSSFIIPHSSFAAAVTLKSTVKSGGTYAWTDDIWTPSAPTSADDVKIEANKDATVRLAAGGADYVFNTLTVKGPLFVMTNATLHTTNALSIIPASATAGKGPEIINSALFSNVVISTSGSAGISTGVSTTKGVTNHAHFVKCSFDNDQATLHCGGWFSGSAPAIATYDECDFTIKVMTAYRGGVHRFRNCTLNNMGTGSCDFGGSAEYPGTFIFENCRTTGLYPSTYPSDSLSGSSTSLSRLIISGGTNEFYKLSTGADGCHLDLVVTNHASVVFQAENSSVNTIGNAPDAKGKGGGAEVLIEDSTISNLAGNYLHFGSGKGGTTTMAMNRSTITGNATVLGNKGWLDLTMNQSTVDVQRVFIGFNAAQDLTKTTTVHQIGGLVRANDGSDVAVCWDGVAHPVVYKITDGGVVETPRLAAGGNDYTGALTSYAHLVVDGATVRKRYHSDAQLGLIYGFQTAEIGKNGLVLDTNGYDGQTFQTFTEAEDAVGQARVTKIGEGTLTLRPASWAISETAVAGGTLKPDVTYGESVTEVAWETSLVVTNGAALSLAGNCTKLTVDALTLDGAAIEIDPSDQIVVAGALAVTNLTVTYTAAAVAPVTNTFLTCAGALTSAQQHILEVALKNAAITAGESQRVLFAYDAESGTTTIRLAYQTKKDPLAATTTWKGATGDLWNDALNGWTDGVPSVAKKAVFDGTGAADVTVPDGAAAGALRFAADGYTLAGATLAMAADYGAAEIETLDGAATVAADLEIGDTLIVTNAPGTDLTLSGQLTHGGIEKLGKGHLTLSGDNVFGLGVTLSGGRTTVASDNGLGFDDEINAGIKLANNTLTFDNPSGATVVPREVVIKTPGAKQSGIIETVTDAEIGTVSCTQGGFLKRGYGKLTVNVGRDVTLINNRVSNSYYAQSLYDPTKPELADGTSADNEGFGADSYMTGVTVMEGTLVFRKAEGTAAQPVISATADATMLGLHSTNVVESPKLVFDGVTYDASGMQFLANGYNRGNDYQVKLIAASLRPVLTLVNGAYLKCSKFLQNTYAASNGNMKPCAGVTNATIEATSAFWFSDARLGKASIGTGACSTYRVKESKLLSPKFYVQGKVDTDFDATEVRPSSASAYATLTPVVPIGSLNFRNGSVLRAAFDFSKFDSKSVYGVFTISFDGSAWQYGAGDYTLSGPSTAELKAFFAIETRGDGLLLAPAAATTFTFDFPLTGEGGLVVDGPGTVKFNADTLKFTGAVDLRQGTLDAGGQSVAVGLSHVDGASTVTLNDCAVTGRVLVDMTDSPLALGASFTIAKLTGSTSKALRFKTVNFADCKLRGVFSTDADGNVTMTVIRKPGIVIMVN